MTNGPASPESAADGARPRVYLVDGSALAYRAYHAFAKQPLSNDRGMNTGAVFGYVKTLQKLIETEHPEYFAVVFDTPHPTFRHERYAEYKATRDKMPDEMVEQLPYMKRVTTALGIKLIEMPGFEADDVIGTLAVRAAADGAMVSIVTGDKDFMQLVSPDIRLYNIMKSDVDVLIIDREKVIEKFGVPPERVIDVLALMGDSSDNVPGVPGVGEKTAEELIRQFGSFEGVFANAASVKKPKLRASLLENRAIADLSRELVTIKTDVPEAPAWQGLAPGPEETAELASLYRELKFTTLLNALKTKTPAGARDYRILATLDEVRALAETLKTLPAVVMDTETTSLVRHDARLVGLSFSWQTGAAVYIPVNAGRSLLADAGIRPLDPDEVLAILRPILEGEMPKKVGQNIKYDIGVLLNYAIKVGGVGFDTMIASYLLDSGGRAHDLDSLSLKYFDHTKIKTTDLIGTGKNQTTMDMVPVAAVGEYAAEDADFTWRLYERFRPALAERGLEDLFRTIEMPLVEVLLRMEEAGITVDRRVLSDLERELTAEIERVEKRIREIAGEEINLASPKQLAYLIFEKLELHKAIGLKPQKTKTGYSTNQETLEQMGDLPLPKLILEHRSLTKLLGTYVATLPDLIDRVTGRIHTSFNQTVAATGRLSSSDPNLQNIPVRSPMGRRIREAFTASDASHVLMSADYSQIELRIMAHVAADPVMIEAFTSGRDIHKETAARVFGKAPAEIDAAMRSKAKSINFGILYGMGKQRLARETGMTQDEAQAFIDRYFENFPTVRSFIDGAKETARATGMVTTLLGRQRAIPDIHSKNGALRSAAENMAVNTPIQGTAADFIKIAMIRIDQWIRESGVRGRMVLQVHDELLFDVPHDEAALFRTEVPRLMSGVYELKVPLTVDVGEGPHWSAAH